VNLDLPISVIKWTRGFDAHLKTETATPRRSRGGCCEGFQMCIKTEGPFNNCIVKWPGGGQTNDYTVFILQMNSEDLSTVLGECV